MVPTHEGVARVVRFRDRLVAFANYVAESVDEYQPTSPRVRMHIAEEQGDLSQEYGELWSLLARCGLAGMRQYGMIVSQDVVRDAIQSPDHPGYPAIAKLAMGHLDVIIGQLRAEAKDEPGPERTRDDLYRRTSVAYWLERFVGALRWLSGTHRGRIVAMISAVVLTIIGGIAAGAAQAWFERLFAGQ